MEMTLKMKNRKQAKNLFFTFCVI